MKGIRLNEDRSLVEMLRNAMKENGGYVFASDHSIPNSVSFQTMTEIADLAKKLGTF